MDKKLSNQDVFINKERQKNEKAIEEMKFDLLTKD